MNYSLNKLFAVAALASLFAPAAALAQVQEPDTIFYGEIINRTSGLVNQLIPPEATAFPVGENTYRRKRLGGLLSFYYWQAVG